MKITKTKIAGGAMAVAVAGLLAAAPMTSAQASGKAAEKPCYGANACSGKTSCKTSKNACAGHNKCKGQGVVMATPEDCEHVLGGSLEEAKVKNEHHK